MIRHVLITNDFPPKVGGIQAYLGEIYQRMDPESFMVITTAVPGCEDFDRGFGAPIVRLGKRLLPTPATIKTLRHMIASFSPQLVIYDPIFPIGAVGPALGLPYALIAHGAEVRVPAYVPVLRRQLQRTIRGSLGVVAAGGYPADEVRRLVADTKVMVVPPGIAVDRYAPVAEHDRTRLRRSWMSHPDDQLILFVSRLVPRKGADTLLRAAAQLDPRLKTEIHVVGDGRDWSRLRRLALGVSHPVVFHGSLPEAAKIELYQAADLFVFPARDRWLGIEREGFGIVILEAQACGTPAIIGSSGGTREALSPTTGHLLRAGGVDELAAVLGGVLARPAQLTLHRSETSAYVRTHFDYDRLGKAYEESLHNLVNG
ncbi:glycosyltransferase family 4 protein [Ferrimicrobium sp.]|uniref:glycosyltransferase family 4 protein n=1 Tax=Ferrimicrobium sp. TaxID=2926050 RepID=UPI002623C90A|nr:glycosyltransferase family 4 protein [Ferrimicrobium sp.]